MKKLFTTEINDPRFVKFIQKHHVLSFSTCIENQPWCCACFYAYHKKSGAFVFSSDKDTRHVNEILTNNKAAINIILETKIIGVIQGLQISGVVEIIDTEKQTDLKQAYLKRFPFAILATTSLWVFYPDFIKLTDNKLGFGTKLIWQKEL